MKDSIFYNAIAGFVAGIFVHSFVEIGGAFSWFVALLGAVVFLYTQINHPSVPSLEEEGRPTTPIILAAVFLLAAGLGMWRYDFAERENATKGLEPYVNQAVTLEGLISDEPDVREANTHLVFQVLPLSSPLFQRGRIEEGVVSTTPPVPSPPERTFSRAGLESLPADWQAGRGGKILLFAPHEPKYAYGDRMRVEGRLEHPKNFVDEVSGREVDYKAYLAKDGIYYSMLRPKITLLSHGEGNIVIEKLFTFKHAFIKHINQLIPQPHSALLGGLVVGAKQSLGKELLDDFRTVGVIHIVVLSGYNITIIAVFIEWLLSRLRKNLRLALAALAMILFALMVGASATVIRATVMALLALLARGTARMYQVTRALLVAGVIMLLHNPKILVFDVSFQLSFLATLGLIYVSPLVEPKVKWVTERWHIREIVVATVATQLFVLPFLLYKTGIFSVVSLPVNLLVLSAIPVTMLFGFAAGIIAFASAVLAFPFALVAYAFLAYELGVVEWFAKLPFAAISLPNFPLWLVVLWYTVYAVLYYMWRKRQSTGTLKESLLLS